MRKKYVTIAAAAATAALLLAGCGPSDGMAEGRFPEGATSQEGESDTPEGSEAKDEAGTETGIQEECVCPEPGEVITADRHNQVVPNLVGQNLGNIGWEGLSGNRYFGIGHATLDLLFVTPTGEAITEENVATFRVTEQEPAAGTVFTVTYVLDEDGNEYDNLVDSSGISSITLTVEPVG